MVPSARDVSAATELAEGGVALGDYVLEARIGEGGMGVVYRARSSAGTSRADLVAIKVLKERTPERVTRFVREARIAAAIRHPNLVAVHEVIDRQGEPPAIVMELLEGESLAERLARSRRLSLEDCASIVVAVARATRAIHARGVVHRDLKPDNVFLCRDGTVKVLDFGIAKANGSPGSVDAGAGTLTRTGQVLGTPHYMAPEVIFGEDDIDGRADVWSLGVIVYEALAGTRPFDGDNAGQVFKAVALEPPIPLARRAPGLPDDVARLVERMLEHARAARLQDLDEVVRVLGPYAGDGPRGEAREGGLPEAPAARRRTWGAGATLVAASIVGLLLLLWAATPASDPSTERAPVRAVPPSAARSTPSTPDTLPTPSAVERSATAAAVVIAPAPASAEPRSTRRAAVPTANASPPPATAASAASASSGAPRHRSGGLRPEEL